MSGDQQGLTLTLGGGDGSVSDVAANGLSGLVRGGTDECEFVVGEADGDGVGAGVVAGGSAGSGCHTSRIASTKSLANDKLTVYAKVMTSYRVQILTDNGSTFAGTYTVEAVDKDAAKIEAVKAVVRYAKGYNAKYHASLVAGGVAWALRSENHADYAAGTVRKAPTRKVAA